MPEQTDRSWDTWIWMVFWPVFFLALLAWASSGCGTAHVGSYLTTTRQGVDVYTLGNPYINDVGELDDALDLCIQRWRERFPGPDLLIARFYEHLPEIEIVLRDSLIRIDHGENKYTLHSGMEKGNEIHIMRVTPCWGQTLAHEMAHWLLWVSSGDPQPTHPAGVVWGTGDSYEMQMSSELIRSCYE